MAIQSWMDIFSLPKLLTNPPQFKDKEGYRAAMATCLVEGNGAPCSPAMLSAYQLFPAKLNPAQFHDVDGYSFKRAGEAYRMICDSGHCFVQRWVESPSDGFPILAGCANTPEKTTTEDVGTFKDSVPPNDILASPDIAKSNSLPAAQLSVGLFQNCARLDNSDVWCWGFGEFKKNASSPTLPQKITNTPGFKLTNGFVSSCGILNNSPLCLGDYGLMGVNTENVIDGIKGLSNIKELVFGGVVTNNSHSLNACAITNSGDLFCSGAYKSDPIFENIPKKVQGFPEKLITVAVSADSVCAQMVSGKIMCLGSNTWGELGNGNQASQFETVPAYVTGIENATSLAAGNHHFCVSDSPGKIQCWGGGTALFDDANKNQYSPRPILAVPDAKRVVAASEYTCAIDFSGKIKCWGLRTYGGVANPIPTEIEGVSDVMDVGIGVLHACALTKKGEVFCWGVNDFAGQLGLPPSDDNAHPYYKQAVRVNFGH